MTETPCSKCGSTVYRKRVRKDTTCKKCLSKRQNDYLKNHPDKRKLYQKKYVDKIGREEIKKRSRDNAMRYRFDITTEDYDCMFSNQGGGCAICGKPPSPSRRLDIDHIHGTKTVRGLLCNQCNQAIGLFSDNTDNMRKAIDYLSRFENKKE